MNLDSSVETNLTEYNSSYVMNIYVSKCQYWNEIELNWKSDGCQVKHSLTFDCLRNEHL